MCRCSPIFGIGNCYESSFFESIRAAFLADFNFPCKNYVIDTIFQKSAFRQKNSTEAFPKDEKMMKVVFIAMLSNNFQKDYNDGAKKIVIRGEEPIFTGWNKGQGEAVTVERWESGNFDIHFVRVTKFNKLYFFTIC